MPATENDAFLFDLARKIREKIEGAPGKQLLGSEIGIHINNIAGPQRRNFPDGWRLSRFLNDYAPDLTIVGRQGADLLWGLSIPDDAPTIDISDLLPSLIEEENLSSPSVELKSCRLKNYRSLEDVECPLHNVTVLVGANAAGKSNLLDGLFRAVQLTHRKPKTVFSGRHDSSRITRRGATSPFELHVQGSNGWGYRFKGAKEKEPEGFSYSMGTKKWNTSPSLLLTSMSSAFGPAVYLQLNARQLQRSTFSEEERPYLQHDGLYLASVLDSIAGSNRGRLKSILERVRSVLPFVEDLRTPRKKLLLHDTEVVTLNGTQYRQAIERTMIGNALEVKVRGSGWTPADQLSEGTLLIIGLHTILSRDSRPKLLLLDDLDRGLHPLAQEALIKQLMELATPTTKIVCTSHSPFILDPLPIESIQVVQQDKHGRTHLKGLSEHPDWERWRGQMTAGEFWLYAGDSWVTE